MYMEVCIRPIKKIRNMYLFCVWGFLICGMSNHKQEDVYFSRGNLAYELFIS